MSLYINSSTLLLAPERSLYSDAIFFYILCCHVNWLMPRAYTRRGCGLLQTDIKIDKFPRHVTHIVLIIEYRIHCLLRS